MIYTYVYLTVPQKGYAKSDLKGTFSWNPFSVPLLWDGGYL